MVLVEAGVEQPVAVGVTRQEVHGAAAERPPLVSAACRSGRPGAGSRQAGAEAATAGSERRACVRACAAKLLQSADYIHPGCPGWEGSAESVTRAGRSSVCEGAGRAVWGGV